jgi:folate-binding protein YgfZ
MRLLEKARVSDDVEFRDLGPCGHIEVHGPASGGPVSGVAGADVRSLSDYAFLTFPVDRHHEGHTVRLRTFREDGYAIWSAGASLAEVWERLVRADVTPIGRDAAEVLRIEAGVPRFGADMGEDTLALEVAPESAISYTKGCYLGQEIVARGTYVGQVRRKLLGLRVEGDLSPGHGDRVSRGDREVGSVTSGAWSPTIGWVVALALLRIDQVSTKDPLFINRGGWDLRARLHDLPFARGAA